LDALLQSPGDERQIGFKAEQSEVPSLLPLPHYRGHLLRPRASTVELVHVVKKEV